MKGAADLFPETVPVEGLCVRRFKGTANPRHLRVLQELKKRPLTREALDRAAGCSNGPDLVMSLRERGLDIDCVRVPVLDRDGKWVEAGIYALSPRDRRLLAEWEAGCSPRC